MNASQRELLPARVFVIRNFLTESECGDYISLSEKKGFTKASIKVEGETNPVVEEIRNNDRYRIQFYFFLELNL